MRDNLLQKDLVYRPQDGASSNNIFLIDRSGEEAVLNSVQDFRNFHHRMFSSDERFIKRNQKLSKNCRNKLLRSVGLFQRKYFTMLEN